MAKKTISLADKAYEIIKTNIINLTYPPGMPLTESMLSEELNMSRNPIRAAIRTLQSEGLIVSDYHKSMTVKEITDKDVRDIYQLRELLEGIAFRKIFEDGKAEEYSYRIEEKVYRIEEKVIRMCAAENNPYQWELADANMHMEIIRIFENARINRIYETNLAELVRMGLYSVKNGMEIHKTDENLKEMVKYMRSNDYSNAFAILQRDHFHTGKDSALEGTGSHLPAL